MTLRIRSNASFLASLWRRRDVEADGDAIEVAAGSGIALHHERIVAGDDVGRRIGEAEEKIEAFEHFSYVVNHGKGTALFEIIVEVGSVGSEDDPAAASPDARALQPGGMAADAMYVEAGG